MEQIEANFDLSDEQLHSISDILLREMSKGLAKSTNPNAKVKMIPSYVTSLPDGSGKFMCYKFFRCIEMYFPMYWKMYWNVFRCIENCWNVWKVV